MKNVLLTSVATFVEERTKERRHNTTGIKVMTFTVKTEDSLWQWRDTRRNVVIARLQH